MDKYISQYELMLTRLVDSGEPLNESLTKAFFLRGITDREYSTTKDICADSKNDFTTCMSLMKKKSTELNSKDSTQKSFHPRKAHQKKITMHFQGTKNFQEVKYGLKMPMTQRLLLVRRLEGGLKIE
jgi:hypothetical protein